MQGSAQNVNCETMVKSNKSPLPIDERISFLIHRISARVFQVCNPYFREYGVDLHNSRMLVILMEDEQACVGDLVTRMVLPQSTISHQIMQLEKRGLIKRKRDEEDSRSVTVSLGSRTAVQRRDLRGLSGDGRGPVAGRAEAHAPTVARHLRSPGCVRIRATSPAEQATQDRLKSIRLRSPTPNDRPPGRQPIASPARAPDDRRMHSAPPGR